jgi:hypothetical protein
MRPLKNSREEGMKTLASFIAVAVISIPSRVKAASGDGV